VRAGVMFDLISCGRDRAPADARGHARPADAQE
jgi:hypothetical protein